MNIDYEKAIKDAICYAKVHKNRNEKLDMFSNLCILITGKTYKNVIYDPLIKEIKKYCENNNLCLTDEEIYGIGTPDFDMKFQYAFDNADEITRQVYEERLRLLEHINEINFSPSSVISFKTNIAQDIYNRMIKNEGITGENLYYINCALNYIKIKDFEFLKDIENENYIDAEMEIDELYIENSSNSNAVSGIDEDIIYRVECFLNPQKLVQNEIFKAYTSASTIYPNITSKTLEKNENKNSKEYYNLVNDLKLFRGEKGYIEAIDKYIKTLVFLDEKNEYKIKDGKLNVQCSSLDDIVNVFYQGKFHATSSKKDIIFRCFKENVEVCLMHEDKIYLSFKLIERLTKKDYIIDVIKLNHKIKLLADKEKDIFDLPSKDTIRSLNKVYVNIYDAFINHDCIGKLQIISPGYNHATGTHKNDVEDVFFNLVYEKKNSLYGIIRIKGYYCHTCNFYFDFEESFKQQLRILGVDSNQIILDYYNYKFEHLDGKLKLAIGNLADKSILGRFGYSITKSEEQRHSIIDLVLEKKYSTKAELVNLLSWLIKFNGVRSLNAKNIWQKDIMYINYY